MTSFERLVVCGHHVMGALLAIGCTTANVAPSRTGASPRPHEAGAAGRLEQAQELARVGDYVRAEQYAEAALEGGANPTLVEPLLLEVCIRDHRYRAAIDHGESYLKRNPGDDAVRELLAALHVVLGHADNARRELEIVLQHRPNLPSAHYRLGVLLRDDLSSLSEADQHFREYLRLAPNGPYAAEVESSLLTRLP